MYEGQKENMLCSIETLIMSDLEQSLTHESQQIKHLILSTEGVHIFWPIK